ncbi:hypothetical protein G7Y89_g602 [Cudoniella acicularis]|uniref:Uncharacterized protein n=1 Tax=Cudoniella acicularis TaxID=354080 RepID=A0A8H4RXR7_9HELO|nr:hypothetical protein G7Y89_g602 [Cudoniella acicularis]
MPDERNKLHLKAGLYYALCRECLPEPQYQLNFKPSASEAWAYKILGICDTSGTNTPFGRTLSDYEWYSAIGRQFARVAKAFGMDVIAYTMRERFTPEARFDDSYCVTGTGDPKGLLPSKWFHGTSKEDLNNFLSQDLDLLVIYLPLTPLTTHVIRKE